MRGAEPAYHRSRTLRGWLLLAMLALAGCGWTPEESDPAGAAATAIASTQALDGRTASTGGGESLPPAPTGLRPAPSPVPSETVSPSWTATATPAPATATPARPPEPSATATPAPTPPLPAATTAVPTPRPAIQTPLPPSATRPPVVVTARLPTAAALAPSPAPPTRPPRDEPRYVYPVQPATAGSYGPCHHDYPASDIFAPIGTAFVAVTDGVIDYVSGTDPWDPAVDDPATRGGISAALVGDDGVRYYGSHLSALVEDLRAGMRVEAGQVLGYIGKSGNARNTPPHLHFGISRPTSPDDWAVRRGQINPVPYLDAWRAGRATTPDLQVAGGGVC